MYIFLMILAIIVCVLLGLIVLIQNPKGGGLTANFSSSSQLMGVQKTGDILEKGTWILAITLMVLSLAINVSLKSGSQKGSTQNDKIINEASDKASKAAPTSSAPLNLPAGTPAKPTR